eukprot:scaffold14219_cov159-Skeletonema_dohrnii-CCMP3373.AAC.1
MANQHGPQDAVDCHIYSVRYVMLLSVMAAIPNWASSGHLRRCSDADTTNKYLSRDKLASLLPWPSIMGH